MIRECGRICGRTRDRKRIHMGQEELEKEFYEYEFQSYCKPNYKPIVYQRNGHLSPFVMSAFDSQHLGTFHSLTSTFLIKLFIIYFISKLSTSYLQFDNIIKLFKHLKSYFY